MIALRQFLRSALFLPMKSFRPAAILLALFCAVLARADDTVADVIAKARAYLGSEAALSSIQSVHYFGTYEASDPKTAGVHGQIDVIFQSPYRMRQVITLDGRVETTGLDGYSAWVFEQERKDGGRYRLTPLGTLPVLRARANVWENLAFYRGLEAAGGHIEDGGTVTLDGRPARKLTFVHDERIKFVRWFDPATGQLRQTETDEGTTIREEGLLTVAGLRFPQKLITSSKGQDGIASTATISFDKMTVNEPLADSFFAPPSTRPAAPAVSAPALSLPKMGPDSAPAGK
jgi:outer membrane lipoprotein-sorting protein